MGPKLELICGADGHQTLSKGESHQCWPIDFRGCEKYRYMDDILMACTSFNELQAIASEAVDLFRSRGFKLVEEMGGQFPCERNFMGYS